MNTHVDGKTTNKLPELTLSPNGSGVTFAKVMSPCNNSTTSLKEKISNLIQQVDTLLNTVSPFELFLAREEAEKKKAFDKEAAKKAVAQAKITPAKVVAMKNSEVTTNAANDAWFLEKSAPLEGKLAARINARLLSKAAKKNHSGRYCDYPKCLYTLTYEAQRNGCIHCRKCRQFIISRWIEYDFRSSFDDLEEWDKFCGRET